MLIFGIREIGTLAAARLLADKQYAPDRRALQRATGTLGGELEVLLHVSHSAGEIQSALWPRACRTLEEPTMPLPRRADAHRP